MPDPTPSVLPAIISAAAGISGTLIGLFCAIPIEMWRERRNTSRARRERAKNTITSAISQFAVIQARLTPGGQMGPVERNRLFSELLAILMPLRFSLSCELGEDITNEAIDKITECIQRLIHLDLANGINEQYAVEILKMSKILGNIKLPPE